MGAFVLLLISILPIVVSGVLMARGPSQQKLDNERRTYSIFFPGDLNADGVIKLLESMAGSLRPRKFFLGGVPTLAAEVWVGSGGYNYILKVPYPYTEYVLNQFQGHGYRLDRLEEVPHAEWTRAVELGLSNSSRPLRISDVGDVSGRIVQAARSLLPGERVMLQWVFTPAAPRALPIYREAKSHHASFKFLTSGNLANRDEVSDRRRKLEEPNLLAVMRVASIAQTPTRATHLLHQLKHAFSSVHGSHTRFEPRTVLAKDLQARIDKASTPVLGFPIQLTTSELAALLAWPLNNPYQAGMPPRVTRHLPAPDNVAREGRIIGINHVPGRERPVAIAFQDARKHVHVSGPTGVGKTVLMANMMKQDMEQGYGVVLIENKGDLFDTALDYVPPDRIKDVIILDVNDHSRPVGFNILNQGDPRVVIDELSNLFEYLYQTTSVWAKEVLYHGLRTLATDPKLSFVDLAPLLVPMSAEEVEWRDSLIRELRDKELRQFWQRFENQPRSAQDRIVQPVMDRIWQLNARPELRNIIGQSTSSFQMSDVIADSKILLVNLSGLARDTASLTGTLLMNALWHAVKTTPSVQPTFLYLDEFQDFVKLPVDPEDMLAKARSFGLGMTLAHQHLGQLPTELRNAVLANARTKIVFQTSSTDAQAMSREFGSSVDDSDFMHLGRFEAIARVATGDGVSAPLTLSTREPAKGYGRGKQVRWESRQEHGRPVAEVEADIERRRTGADRPQRKRPSVGKQDGWGGSVGPRQEPDGS